MKCLVGLNFSAVVLSVAALFVLIKTALTLFVGIFAEKSAADHRFAAVRSL
jgi:hypothetical protein